jgi:arginase
MSSGLAVLGVPSSVGAHAPGQEKAPAAFRAAGLIERLRTDGQTVEDLGDLPVARYQPDPARRRAQNAHRVLDIARGTADQVAAAAGRDARVLVLGGDCTIQIGVVAGLVRTTERVGLVYVDAGFDLNTPTSVRLGFLDWMGVAHLVGEPDAVRELVEIGPRVPLLDFEDIEFLGTVRDELTDWERELAARHDLNVHWSEDVATDPEGTARRARSRLEPRVDRISVHFDVDVLDFIDFPAADFPTINAGLTFDAAMRALEVLVASPKCAALTVSEFNPDHVDPDHQLVTTFVRRVTEAFRHRP